MQSNNYIGRESKNRFPALFFCDRITKNKSFYNRPEDR